MTSAAAAASYVVSDRKRMDTSSDKTSSSSSTRYPGTTGAVVNENRKLMSSFKPPSLPMVDKSDGHVSWISADDEKKLKKKSSPDEEQPLQMICIYSHGIIRPGHDYGLYRLPNGQLSHIGGVTGSVLLNRFCEPFCLGGFVHDSLTLSGSNAAQGLADEDSMEGMPAEIRIPAICREALAWFSPDGRGLTHDQWVQYNREENRKMYVVPQYPYRDWTEKVGIPLDESTLPPTLRRLVMLHPTAAEPPGRVPIAPHGHIMEVRSTPSGSAPKIIGSTSAPPAISISTAIGAPNAVPASYAVAGISNFYEKAKYGSEPYGAEIIAEPLKSP